MNRQSAELTIPAQLSCLTQASAWLIGVSGQLDIEAEIVSAMDLCLEELVTNSIKYGLDTIAPEEQLIRVTVQNLGEIVRLTIVDKANAFDPREPTEKVLPANVMEAEIGGLGLLLVRKLTHRFAYQRDGDSNIMVLEFALPAADV